jgi:cytochrome c oxidase assembly protein subunit 15
MKLRNTVRLLAQISLVLTFVVIVAGSVVRMTGSGMGCPDWPKCFGYLVPPTDEEVLLFKPQYTYEEGQMIVRNDTLWVANSSFSTGEQFSHNDWHKYPKHDYAIFNVLHTWVEYINRLATVVYGIPVFLLSLFSLILLIRQRDWIIFVLAFLTDVMVGFEAWLGKLVVDGNLVENSITYHMVGSIALVMLLSIIVFRLSKEEEVFQSKRMLRAAFWVLSVLIFVQILLGTQVREEVDIVARANDNRGEWIDLLPSVFYIHRSFSLLILVLASWIYFQSKATLRLIQYNWAMLVLLLELLVGIVLAYLEMPAPAQPLHLLLGVMCFALVFYAALRIQFKRA